MEYGYIRVSSKSQAENNSLAEQEQAILEKYPSAEIYREVYTAAKDFNNRVVFNELVDRLVSEARWTGFAVMCARG